MAIFIKTGPFTRQCWTRGHHISDYSQQPHLNIFFHTEINTKTPKLSHWSVIDTIATFFLTHYKQTSAKGCCSKQKSSPALHLIVNTIDSLKFLQTQENKKNTKGQNNSVSKHLTFYYLINMSVVEYSPHSCILTGYTLQTVVPWTKEHKLHL